MDRKKFLSRLGSSGLVAMMPLTNTMASSDEEQVDTTETKEKIVRKEEGAKLNIFGNPQYHKVTGVETGNQIFEWVENLRPGTGIPPHIHTKEDEIFRVLSGEVEIMVNNKSTVLKAGDMAFAPKNIVHSWKVVGDKEAKMCTSAFPAGMEHMFDEFNDLPAGKPDFAKVVEISAKYGIQFI